MKVFGIFAILVLMGLAGLTIAFAFDRDGFWRFFFGEADLGPVEFTTLEAPAKSNHATACPAEYCRNIEPQILSPVFDMRAANLARQLFQSIDREPGIKRVDDQSHALYARFVARSPLMRFPDTADIRIISLEDGRSSIAIHSRAQIGSNDFGKNRERIEKWIALAATLDRQGN